MRYMAAVSVAVLAGILFIACAGSQYGGLRPAKRGESALSNDPVGADYRYYQTPNVNRPNAIIAIHKNYTLQTDAWSEISAAGGFSNRHVYSGSMGMAPKILEIRGPQGEHIGVWYSVWTSTVVKMLDQRTVMVYPPSQSSGTANRDRD